MKLDTDENEKEKRATAKGGPRGREKKKSSSTETNFEWHEIDTYQHRKTKKSCWPIDEGFCLPMAIFPLTIHEVVVAMQHYNFGQANKFSAQKNAWEVGGGGKLYFEEKLLKM